MDKTVITIFTYCYATMSKVDNRKHYKENAKRSNSLFPE